MPTVPHPILNFIPARAPKHRKPVESRRAQRIAVRVSSSEYEEICALAVARRCSLASILRGAVAAIPPSVAVRPVLVEFRRLAGNLNQVLRLLHEGFPAAGEVRSIVEDLHHVLVDLQFSLTNARRDP